MAFGDIVLIWRVWIVWNRSFRSIVLPSMVLIASFSELHIHLCYRLNLHTIFQVLGMMNAASSISYNDLAKILPIPTVILAVGNTALCTALIAGRLAYVRLGLCQRETF